MFMPLAPRPSEGLGTFRWQIRRKLFEVDHCVSEVGEAAVSSISPNRTK
jgi:hypothetical protein